MTTKNSISNENIFYNSRENEDIFRQTKSEKIHCKQTYSKRDVKSSSREQKMRIDRNLDLQNRMKIAGKVKIWVNIRELFACFNFLKI